MPPTSMTVDNKFPSWSDGGFRCCRAGRPPYRLSQYPHPSHTDYRRQPVPGHSRASGTPTVLISHQPHEVPLVTTTRMASERAIGTARRASQPAPTRERNVYRPANRVIGTVDHLGQQVTSAVTRRKSPSLTGCTPDPPICFPALAVCWALRRAQIGHFVSPEVR